MAAPYDRRPRFDAISAVVLRASSGLKGGGGKLGALGATWAGGGAGKRKTAPRRPQEGPGRPQDGPRQPQDGPEEAQDSPKMALARMAPHPIPRKES